MIHLKKCFLNHKLALKTHLINDLFSFIHSVANRIFRGMFFKLEDNIYVNDYICKIVLFQNRLTGSCKGSTEKFTVHFTW